MQDDRPHPHRRGARGRLRDHPPHRGHPVAGISPVAKPCLKMCSGVRYDDHQSTALDIGSEYRRFCGVMAESATAGTHFLTAPSQHTLSKSRFANRLCVETHLLPGDTPLNWSCRYPLKERWGYSGSNSTKADAGREAHILPFGYMQTT